MKSKKTLFIILRLGVSHRNVLRTDLLRTLQETPNLRVVIISPLGKEPSFKEEFVSDRVMVEEVPGTKVGFFEKRLKNLKAYLWGSRKFTVTYGQKTRLRYGRVGLLWRNLLGWGLRLLGITEEDINRLEVRLFRSKRTSRVYDLYRPDAVLTTQLFSTNVHMLKEAKKRQIKLICFVDSWDALTSKGPFSIGPDRLLVWNEIMKKEASEFHHFPSKNIFAVGVPQFDIYVDHTRFMNRETFMKQIGLDSSHRLLTYAATPEFVTSTGPKIIELLCDLIESNQLLYPSQLLVRLHPQTTAELEAKYAHFYRKGKVVIQKPGRTAQLHDGWDPTQHDMLNLAQTLYHSDAVLTVASTMLIDAVALDKPVVCIAFDGKETLAYLKGSGRHYDCDHIQNVVRTGGIQIVYTYEELVDALNRYLKNPQQDAEGRRKIRQEQCYHLDGGSGERAAFAVLRELGLDEGLASTAQLSSPSPPEIDSAAGA